MTNGQFLYVNTEEIYKSFLRKKVESGKRRFGLHVSDLVQDCIRKSWYRMSGLPQIIDDASIINFYYGTTIHESFNGMFDIMEYKMHVNPFTGEFNDNPKFQPKKKDLYKWVSGSLDAITDDSILDFKTCGKLPSKLSTQYFKQIQFYSYMYYVHTGKFIPNGEVLYIEKSSSFKNTRLFRFENFEPEINRELMCITMEELEKDDPPPKNQSYLCNSCPYISTCEPW